MENWKIEYVVRSAKSLNLTAQECREVMDRLAIWYAGRLAPTSESRPMAEKISFSR